MKALDGKKRERAEQLDPTETTTFWRKIRSEEVSHNERILGVQYNKGARRYQHHRGGY